MSALMNPESDIARSSAPAAENDIIFSWYRKAALADGNKRQAVLCSTMQDGPDWYFSAANNGDKYAQYSLGMMYLKGVVMPQNSTKAAMWLSKSALAGVPFACLESARLCDAGIGIDKDHGSAVKLYRKAFQLLNLAEQRSPDREIERLLSALYQDGLGCPKDENLAEFWMNTAQNSESADDHPAAKKSDQMDDTSSEPAASPEIPVSAPVPKRPKQKRTGSRSKQRKRKNISRQKPEQPEKSGGVKDFLDMIAPSVLDFSHPNYFICGNTYRCVWAIREYPTSTEDQALLKELGEKNGVTLRIFVRPVTPYEESKVFKAAERKNRHSLFSSNNIQDSTAAKDNLADVQILAEQIHRTKEKLLHCAVFLELIAHSKEELIELRQEVLSFFARSKMVYDQLWLRQKEGFQTVSLFGSNRFKSQFERILPASSAANLYPFSYSGKADSDGMYIGRDVNGSNIVVNFDRRSADKTNGHILILGNTGEGKSWLLKLLITNFRQMGKKFFILDPDDEYRELTQNLGGCYIDMMAGTYFINVLEPRIWTLDPDGSGDKSLPEAFRKKTRLSQHIAYLRDFFRSYKNFPPEQLDTLEILLEKLYQKFNISDETDFTSLRPEDYPILSDLFALAKDELDHYEEHESQLYTKDILRSLTLGLRDICVGSESTFFNGHTNITNADFIDFSVKDMLSTNENLKNAMFMNIFSYMSHKFLTEGAAEVAIDELHLFLNNKIAIDYIRSFAKRGRKKNSGIILASQNVEDFMLPEVVSYTKPLLSIPTHSFLFYPGSNCDPEEFQRLLSVKPCEYALISESSQGRCLFKCGSERYHLAVQAPKYKADLFGTAGGK